MSRILGATRPLTRRVRSHANYYSFLGVPHNTSAENISDAIKSKESAIRSELENDPKNTKLRRNLVLLKKMNKTLLDPKNRQEYNFSVRQSIAESIQDLNPELKQLDAGENSNKAYSPAVFSLVEKTYFTLF